MTDLPSKGDWDWWAELEAWLLTDHSATGTHDLSSIAALQLDTMYSSASPVFNVMHDDFGAAGDGTTDDVVPIQKAIDAAIAAGKGIVLLPPGIYATTDEIVLANPLARIDDISIWGYGATILSTTTGSILRVGDNTGPFGCQYGGVHGLALESTTAAVGLQIVGMGVYKNTFRDMLIEGKAVSIADSTGIELYPTGKTVYDNKFDHILVAKWDVGISVGYDFNASTGISALNAPNANKFHDIIMTNCDTHGLYVYRTAGMFYSGDFEGMASAGVASDIELSTSANSNTFQCRHESSKPPMIIGATCIKNLILSQFFTAGYTDNSTGENNIQIGTDGNQAYIRSKFGKFGNLRNLAGDSYPLDVAFMHDSKRFYSTVTLIKSIDVDAAETGTDIDYVLDNTVANTTEQVVTIVDAIPAYGEILSVHLRCYETVVGSGSAVMSVDVGNASGGDQLLAAANIDTANDVSSTASGNGPKIAATSSINTVYINFTPTADWDTLTSGRWLIMVTYINYGRMKTLRVG